MRKTKMMIAMVKNNPQTTFKDLQGGLAADGVTAQSSKIQHNLDRTIDTGEGCRKDLFLTNATN